MKRYIRATDFFDYGDSDTRLHLAEDSNTDPKILAELAKDYTSDIIRGCVARNPNTPVAALQRLAKDGDNSVRSAVAYNKSTPIEILNELASDYDWMVQDNVATHPNSDATTLDIVAKHHPDWQTCQDLAENPKTSTETLDYLSTIKPSKNEFKFYGKIISNPNTSLDTLIRMLDMKDGEWLIPKYTDRSDILDYIAEHKRNKRQRRKS